MLTFTSSVRPALSCLALAVLGAAALPTRPAGAEAVETAALAAAAPTTKTPSVRKQRPAAHAPNTIPVVQSKAMPATGRTEIAPQVTLSEGKSKLMHLPSPVTRVSVGDARIADVILLNPSEVYMLGKSVGATNLTLWNKANDATIIDLAVGIDTMALNARFEQLLPEEKGIVITAAADTLVLSGTVADALKADQVITLANAYVQRGGHAAKMGGAAEGAGAAATPGGGQAATAQPKVINMLSIAAPQQVMLEVKVAEISKTLVDQLGVSLGASKTRGSWTYSFLSNLLSNNPSLLDAFNNKNGNFLTLDAQKRDGLVKVLAEPTIMAISGQEASFLAGGKIFIPVSQTNNGGSPTITLEEKEFGVAVRFTPTVLDGGRINLKVAPEVSDLNKEGIGISATGITTTAILPSFTTRRATTTVQLFDGQSFAIGGLIKNNVTTNVKAFPLLGEIPVLGALFRSSDFQTDRSELVFIITPHLVKPLPPDYKLPTDGYIEPSRSEFFLQGKLQGHAPAGVPPAPTASASATGFDVK